MADTLPLVPETAPGAASPQVPVATPPEAITPQPPAASLPPDVPLASQAPQPAVEPPVQSAPAPEAPKEPAKPEPTLLEVFDAAKKSEAKPASEAKSEVEAKPEAKADTPKEPVVEPAAPEPFKFEIPPTLRVDDARMAEFTGILREASSLPPQEVGQKLIGMHAAAMQAYADHVAAEQRRVWNDTNRGWQNAVMSDPVLGGAGHQTAMGAVARVRDMSISDSPPGTPQYERDRKDHEEFLSVTGAGNHPVYLRQLHRMARLVDEAPLPPPDIRPPPNNGQRQATRLRDMYRPNGGAT